MSYRGEDLDLRTSQTWSAAPSDLSSETDAAKNGQRLTARTGPIWVDDTVLSCANYAFDVALAHRSGDVRIEHFLHAMTRIDVAAEALEMRGVRVAALRRESATIIASEIPVGLTNGKTAPRRSDELADVLRVAANFAGRRNAPATIDDVLNVLFDQRTDVQGMALLARHTMRAQVRETLEQFPPLSRYAIETPRYIAPSERGLRTAINEPARYAPESPRSYRPEAAQTATDSIQNSRIEALEQMVRALSNDISSERHVVSGMLKELSRDTQAQRDDQGRLHTGLYDRLQTLEQVMTSNRGAGGDVIVGDGLSEQLLNLEVMLEQRLKELNHGWASLTGRFNAIEAATQQPGLDLKPIMNRLDIIEEALLGRGSNGESNDVADRLKSLEGEIARALAANTASTGRMETLISGFEKQRADFAGPIVDRVKALATDYEAHQKANSDAAALLAERLGAVERALAAEIETAAAKHQAYAQDLGEVHNALVKLNQNQHTLAGSIDQWRSEAAGDVAMISNRLANLDRDNERPIETLNALTTHMDTMNRMIIERYHRRNRFWYWLFGTDDWIGASWPSQAAAIEAERARVKSQLASSDP
ncbi:MAG: Clp protease [Hyphomicrobium sp.]|nr:Clp protease [Hyphomicrobium sp.]